MPKFSENSLTILRTCDVRLQIICEAVVKEFDCRVICGYRGREAQEEAFRTGHSNAQFGRSPHNRDPSMAVDIVPYPVDWQDRERFIYFAGFVMGTATELNVELVWGGDWNRDYVVQDNKFDDLGHFEIRNWGAL